ncbi:MAG: long-chain-acyl-CoA synthetase [SAR324 cluster bacterium]|nr:long-chain-acyl-CoA synthetase [SAR324 cluster bacterium]
MGKRNYYRFLFRYLGLVLFKRKTIGATLEKTAARHGGRVCVLFEDESITYAEMNRRANRRANFFHGLGIAKGDVVCLLMENRPEFLATVLGLAKLGAVTALINHNLKGRALAHTLNLSGAQVLVVGQECLETLDAVLPELERIPSDRIYVDTRWDAGGSGPAGLQHLNALLTAAGEDNPHPPPLNSKDPVLYIYTSGTTGLPKAAIINHMRWFSAGLAMGSYALQVTQRDVVFCALPLYHSNGILIAFGASLINGAALGLSRRFSAGGFWEEAVRFEATCFIYIGEVLRYLLNQAPGEAETRHRITRILGNGLRPDIWPAFRERFGIADIREFYASTEGNAATINMDNVAGSVGTPVLKSSDNTALVRYDVERDAYLRDTEGFCQRCDPGETGELLGEIKAVTPFYGYTNPRETERKILHDVFRKGDAWFRTGDLLKKDEQGYYYFLDRIGDTYRWKGENVSTQEVQEILAGFNGMQLVNVYGVKMPGADGRIGMAAIQLAEGQPFDGAAFHAFAAENLAGYALPGFVRVVQGMDLTGTFKIRKTDIQGEGFDPAATSDPLFYRDSREATYAPLDAAVFQRINSGALKL